MGSVVDRLAQREAQARVVVEGLREEAERVAGALAVADDALSRLVIARETVLEVLGGEPGECGEVERVAVAGRDVALYERITRAFSGAVGPLRPRQVCEALGMPVEARFIEAMRPKLTRLVADGVLVQVGPGLFAPVGALEPA